MKKITFLLFLSSLLMISASVLANNLNTSNSSYVSNYSQNITFVEAGITFSIFQSGEFDFFINKRHSINASVGYEILNISYNSGYNYGPYVQHDDFGAVIQIEQVPIYYDYYGRAIRIGNVGINYNNNRIIGVGGLHLYYNNYQGYYYSGSINSYNRNYYNHYYHNYFLRPSFNNCIVSYSPYRKHYKVNRHHYGMKNGKYKNNVPKNHKRYKKINAKIRSNSRDLDVLYSRKAGNRKATSLPVRNRNVHLKKTNSVSRNLRTTHIDRSKKESGRTSFKGYNGNKDRITEKRSPRKYENSANAVASNSSRNKSMQTQSRRSHSERNTELNSKTKRTRSKYKRSK